MISVGIKELKAKLSSYIDKVGDGSPVIVTEHGEEVAIIMPISTERRYVMSLIKAGNAQWAGGKPKGMMGLKIKGKPLSVTVLDERQ